MGTPVHPRVPPIPGPDCPTCVPYPWPEGCTPTVIRLVFHAMTSHPDYTPPPNDMPIHLSNSELAPCKYYCELYFLDGIFDITYDADIALVTVERKSPTLLWYFYGWLDPCELGPFINTVSWPDDTPIGGNAHVLDMPLSIIVLLTETYNLQPDQDALYDVIDSAIPDHKCVRLTGRTYPGSVLIDVDLSSIPP